MNKFFNMICNFLLYYYNICINKLTYKIKYDDINNDEDDDDYSFFIYFE